jgi:predicted Rossmann fold flavoprotein
MFPTTDHSATIVNCLLDAAKENGVDIRTEHGVRTLEKEGTDFLVHLENREPIRCQALILATGSHPHGHQLAASLGHTIVSPVPSLFTFNVPTSPLLDLAGIALTDAELSLQNSCSSQRGSLLLTHWGFSGPAALKLSAWAARELFACNYRTELYINWIPSVSKERVLDELIECKKRKPLKTLELENPFHLPLNLWKRLVALSGILPGTPMGHINGKLLHAFADRLTASTYSVEGKTTYKTEFVTCGGVELKEVDFKTLQSRLVPGLFFAGEVLNIDGVTGGFNFQNAWTTAFLAADYLAKN